MSIKHQIQKIVFQNVVDRMSDKHKKANNIPETRDIAKQTHRQDIAAKYIYGYQSGKIVMAVMNRVAKFSGITDIKQLKKEHTNAYIQDAIDRGLKKNTLVTERFGIRKFEKCLLNTGRMSKHDQSIAPDVNLPSGSRINPIGRYSEEETRTIIDDIKENYKEEISQGVQLQEVAGLRISELKGLKVRYIDIPNRQIIIVGNTAKGGRGRIVKINEKDIPFLKEVVKGKDPDDKVLKVSKRWVEKVVEKTCDKNELKGRGTHGMRGKFSNDRLRQYCREEGVKYDIKHLKDDDEETLTKKEVEVLEKVSNDLGHNRIGIVRKYYLQR